jgi:antitoxin PrlF
MDHIVMAENGRLVVPAQLRQQLGMAKGGKLVASIREGSLVLEPFDVAMRRVRETARAYIRPGESVADALIDDRRRQASREEGGG